MTRRTLSLIGLIALLNTGLLEASYYETLPQGVRLLAYRRVETSSVTSEFTETGRRQNISFNQNLGAQDLQSIAGAGIYLDEIKAISPEAYNLFTLGQYHIDADAQVKVDGLGLGWGITDRLTVYASLPIYKAEVRMNIERTQGNNYNEVADLLSESGDKSETTMIMEQLTRQLPDADGRLLQTVLTKEYGYQPLGNWNATGMGDLEIGAIYRLTDWDSAGLATSFGLVLPTGKTEDIDVLQDFSFGDGQTDIFVEFGGGVALLDRRLELDMVTRYTHQLPSEKMYRIPSNPGFSLGDRKGSFDEKLGDIIEFRALSKFHLNSWVALNFGYDYRFQQESQYSSEYTQANLWLAENTLQREHRLRGGVSVSSINAYKAKRFPLPMQMHFMAYQSVAGENIPKLTRFDLEFRFFF